MIGPAGTTPGLVSHLYKKWNCMNKKENNEHGQAGARKQIDHQAASALQGREKCILVTKENCLSYGSDTFHQASPWFEKVLLKTMICFFLNFYC